MTFIIYTSFSGGTVVLKICIIIHFFGVIIVLASYLSSYSSQSLFMYTWIFVSCFLSVNSIHLNNESSMKWLEEGKSHLERWERENFRSDRVIHILYRIEHNCDAFNIFYSCLSYLFFRSCYWYSFLDIPISPIRCTPGHKMPSKSELLVFIRFFVLIYVSERAIRRKTLLVMISSVKGARSAEHYATFNDIDNNHSDSGYNNKNNYNDNNTLVGPGCCHRKGARPSVCKILSLMKLRSTKYLFTYFFFYSSVLLCFVFFLSFSISFQIFFPPPLSFKSLLRVR